MLKRDVLFVQCLSGVNIGYNLSEPAWKYFCLWKIIKYYCF